MQTWTHRILRILALVALVTVAIAWAQQPETGVWGWVVVLVGLGGWTGFRGFRYVRAREARMQARIERAIYDRSLRPQAIRALRRRVAHVPKGAGERLNAYVRDALGLAELLDADERYGEAIEVAMSIPQDHLSTIDAGLVRHTRAVTYLRAGDHEGALEALSERGVTGDLELDQRLSLLAAYARAERGEGEGVMEEVHAIERDRGTDPSVVTEARVVMAAALDAMGKSEEALVVLASVGREALDPLSHLGLPRVRGMARELLQASRTPRAKA